MTCGVQRCLRESVRTLTTHEYDGVRANERPARLQLSVNQALSVVVMSDAGRSAHALSCVSIQQP